MKTQTTQKAIMVLSCLIAAFAIVAAGTGVVTGLFTEAVHRSFTSLRGDTIQIWGSGLYKYDSVSGASQEIAQDVVTLCIGIPLLGLALVLFGKGSLRGKVLLAGTLGYFLYTYISLTMLSAYNELFLVYVALMSMSLFAFVLVLLSIDIAALPAHFSPQFPRQTIGGFAIFTGVMLALLWLKLIVPPLLAGTAPSGLDSYTTLVIQAMDLGIIMPAAFLAGVLLLRRVPFGYMLATVVLINGFTMGAALLAMTAGQIMANVEIDPVGAIIFAFLALSNMALVALLFRSLKEAPVAEPVTDVEQPAGRGATRGAPALHSR